ncbi:YafY family protein [Rhizobium sp. L1K21]|uniref:helix-turn-helix transcriptional regulator n=1 Tax=Rhizobium sp. L1K21 TaxID=2954933 RepID=UPI00209217AB|nr:YafY family protein [Rhizobium sp. L1K21]MCO6184958.1 YafY family transcriptional regulator [Rhizobium sp. L1K21]
MSRSQRLINLIQELRQHRYPVSGQKLAETMGVSLRTLYRDIATLQAQGAHIEGEAGLGYVLRPGFLLPPLMFSEDEIEALTLGARWVAGRTDHELARSAQSLLAKVSAVLPPDLAPRLEDAGFMLPTPDVLTGVVDLSVIRKAMRAEHILDIRYTDKDDKVSARHIWPIAIGFFEKVRVVAAWCELRKDYRSFRIDRMLEATDTGKTYPRRRMVMQKEWRERETERRENTADKK